MVLYRIGEQLNASLLKPSFFFFSFANLWWYSIWFFLFFFAVLCQSFQLEKGLSSAGGGIGCWRDGKTSQSIDGVHQHTESFGLYMHQFFLFCYPPWMFLQFYLLREGNVFTVIFGQVWQSDNWVFLCNLIAGSRIFSIWSFYFIWYCGEQFCNLKIRPGKENGILRRCLSGCLCWDSCLPGYLCWDSCLAFIATYVVAQIWFWDFNNWIVVLTWNKFLAVYGYVVLQSRCFLLSSQIYCRDHLTCLVNELLSLTWTLLLCLFGVAV